MTIEDLVGRYRVFAINNIPRDAIIAIAELYPDVIPPHVAHLVDPDVTKNVRIVDGAFISFKGTPYERKTFNLDAVFDWNDGVLDIPTKVDFCLDLGGLI